MFERNNYFVPNQIILTAPDNDGRGMERIQAVLGTLQERNVLGEYNADRVIRIQAFSNNSSEEVPESSSNKLQASTPFCPGLSPEHSNFVVALAEFDEGTISVEELLTEFNELGEGEKDGVTAEPNLIVGSPDYPTGSTSTWNFEPATTQDYFSQWAFDKIDLDLVTPTPEIVAKQVRVVVLDAVPSSLTRSEETVSTGSATIPGSSIVVDWITPDPAWTLDVTVLQPTLASSLPEGADLDLSHHGLFGAQMVRAIAPDSENVEIELVEVLNKEVVGDLFTLILAFNDRVLNYEDPEKPNIDIPTVVNMSLGIRIPPPKAPFNLPESGMEALYAVMQVAHCRNIVVVAASGNNSQMSYPPELAHLPADWSSVIAVAASNMENQRSCFSNQGDIAAPGGDGRLPDDPIPSTPPPLGCISQPCRLS